ncbi:MAG: hypothetical protein HY438_04405 [DPANN group archaeon]|nr:hypothetical protein [DPANN group archaeon]
MERYLISLTPEAKAAGAVSRIEDMLQDIPFQLSNQAKAFTMVPQVNSMLERDGMVIGTITGTKGNGEAYMLGLIFAGPDIIAFDAVSENGIVKTYKAKTPTELRAELTRAMGGEWYSCAPNAPRLSFSPLGREIPVRGLREQVLMERTGLARPASLREQFLADRSGSMSAPGLTGRQLSLLEQYLAGRAAESRGPAPTHPKSLRDNFLEERRARRATQMADWPANDTDLTGLPALLGLDTLDNVQPAVPETKVQDRFVTVRPLENSPEPKNVTVEPIDFDITKDGAVLRRPDPEPLYPVIVPGFPVHPDSKHARPAPATVMSPEEFVNRQALPKTPLPAVQEKAKEDKQVRVDGSVITKSEIDSDMVERFISAQTVHIDNLTIHIHKGRVSKNDEEE